MPITPAAESVTLAHFKPLAGEHKGQSFPVHFNPASLHYTIANAQNPPKQNGQGVQYVSQSTATLTMDLVFDSTMTGADVREATNKMAKLVLLPSAGDDEDVPPNVEFSWGTYTFSGIVTQYRETLDFFSADGVPLRSAINITLSSSGVKFESSKNPNASVDSAGGSEPFVISASLGASAVASSLGDPRAARAIASASGSASLRFSLGASVAVAGSASLSPPAAFATGGIGISAGIGIGAGAGTGMGISATAGAAFTGLRASAGASAGSGISNTRALLPAASASGGGAGFALGGAARNTASGSLNTDVGAGAGLSTRIGFQD